MIIKFLTISESKKILLNSRYYNSNFGKYELLKRSNECKIGSWSDFKLTEINYLKNLYNNIVNCKNNYLSKININIGKLPDNFDWNFPFTVGNTIFFTSISISSIKTDTIIHELIHIHQRLNPNIYYKLYKSLGFIRKNILIKDNIKIMKLTNPDGLDLEWIFRINNKYYLPMELIDKNLNFFTVLILLKRSNNIKYDFQTVKIADLKYLNYYIKYFNRLNVTKQLYHPNEISARLITNTYNEN